LDMECRMQSTLNPKQDDPHDVLMLERDVVEALAGRETSKPVDEAKIGPPANQQGPVAPEFAAAPSVPRVDTSFRATATNTANHRVEAPSGPPSVGRRAVHSIAGLAVAVCIGVAGVVWQAYGEAARQLVATWAPQSVSTASPPDNAASVAQQSAKPAAEASTVTRAPAQAAPLGQTSTADVASTAAAASAESAPLLQSVAHDLANVSQQVEQLKASVAELKANQDQMSRDVAKGSEKALEQSPRLRISAHVTSAAAPPRPPAAPTRRPAQPARPSQAAAAAPLPPPPAPYVPPQAAARYAPPPVGAPYVPRQVEPPPQAAVPPPDPNVPRPPMPVGARFPGFD
jgi:hypothetical protein